MSLPRITIVTPNFNKGEYLGRTIESVVSQGYPNLEYIIVDGGSKDDSVDVIKQHESGLAWWVSEKDNGMYDAIRKGFSHSTGEIMGWIGSDDMLHPGSLYTLAEIFSQLPQVSWLTGANTWFDHLGRTVRVRPSDYLCRLDLLSFNYKWIQQESTYWRRSLYDLTEGIDPAMRLAGDLDLWVKLSRHAGLYNTDALIGGFRQIGGGFQLSDNTDAYDAEAKAVIEREWQCCPDDAAAVKRVFRRRRLHNLLGRTPKAFVSEASRAEIEAHHIAYDTRSRRFVLPC